MNLTNNFTLAEFNFRSLPLDEALTDNDKDFELIKYKPYGDFG